MRWKTLCQTTHLVQVVAGHIWEQVVLDLMVQAAHEPAHQPVAMDIPCGCNLVGMAGGAGW